MAALVCDFKRFALLSLTFVVHDDGRARSGRSCSRFGNVPGRALFHSFRRFRLSAPPPPSQYVSAIFREKPGPRRFFENPGLRFLKFHQKTSIFTGPVITAPFSAARYSGAGKSRTASNLITIFSFISNNPH